MSSRRFDQQPVISAPSKAQVQSKIGKALAHDSAKMHVSGSARYIDDIAEPARTLHLAPGYIANVAAGTVTRMDLSEVEAAPGVVAVLTHEDIPGINDCSPFAGDDPILSFGEIKFCGQVLFAVIAETRLQARHAARLAKIDVEENQPIVTSTEGAEAGTQIDADYAFRQGDPADRLSNANQVFSGELAIGGQEHFYLEGQVALAIPSENGEMRVHSSTQHPSEVQHAIARMLDIDDAAITCECRRMGGAFGGKESQAAQWAALAALAAFKTGRPAKMRLDRDDDMILTGKRHDTHAKWSASLANDGRIDAIDVAFTTRCGCSVDLSPAVNDRMMFHADNAYFYPNANIVTHRVKTNTVSNTAFRGFGGPQGLLFAERLMDQIAIETGQDPLDVRKSNLYADGRDKTPYGMTVEDNIALDIIEALEQKCNYRERRAEIDAFNANSQFLKKGISLTPVKFGIAFTLRHLNQAGAFINVFSDGSVQLNHGGTEMGQGLYMKVAQIVAQEFGIDVGRIRITATATDKVPNAPPTAASSGTDLNGMAALYAARAIKERMAEIAAKLLQADVNDVRFEANAARTETTEISFSELAHRCVLDRVSLSSTGFYATPKIDWDRENTRGRPFLYFAYGASCSEVVIDTLTGEHRLERVDILHDVGNSLNPAIDKGQIEGGFVQGLGWLTSEELVYDERGRLRTHAPSTYKIPTATDIPDAFNVELWESQGNLEATIHRSKAVGEPPFMLAASTFSALTHAVASLGDRQTPDLSAPATPEAILRAVASIDQSQ